MSTKSRGTRDGTGPYTGSYQRAHAGVGKRQAAGKPCPKRKK